MGTTLEIKFQNLFGPNGRIMEPLRSNVSRNWYRI